MSGGAQNVQAAIERQLKDLSVGKPRAEAASSDSQIGAGVNAIVCSDIKRARRGEVVDLNRPDRQIGKGAAACAADVRPQRAAIGSPENMTISAKLVDHGVRDLGVGGIDPNLIDSALPAGRSCSVHTDPWLVVTKTWLVEANVPPVEA